MKVENIKVWKNDKGEAILEQTPQAGRFYIPSNGKTREELAELREAINDALKEDA